MKRLCVLCFVIIIIICFCGCQKDFVKVKTQNISFICNIICEDINFSLSAKTDKTGEITDITLIAPQDIKGLTFSLKGGTLTAQKDNMEILRNTENGTKDNLAVILCDLFSKIKDSSAKKGEKNYILESENFEIFFSPSGLPMKATCFDNGRTFYFTNVSLI